MQVATEKLRAAALAFAAFLAVALSAPTARADRELIVPFHEGGHLVLDQLSGMRVSTGAGFSYAGPAGVAFRTEKAEAFAPGATGSELHTTTFWIAPSADVFVTDHLSVGGLVEIAHTSGSARSGGQSLDLPGQTAMTFLPRVGFFVPFGDRFGLWPRAGVGWTSVDSLSFVSTGGAPVRTTFRSAVLDVDLSFVYRFNETFFLRMGPEVGVTLGGRHTEESGGQSAAADASVIQVSGMTQFGVNLEL
jgi:hypothetical protein